MTNSLYITLIPLLPLLGFFMNGIIAFQQSRGKGFFSTKITSFIACSSTFLAFLISVFAFITLFQNPDLVSLKASNLLDWMILEEFSLSFGFCIDHLTSIMLLFITGVGFLIHVYSIGYMKEDEAYARYMAYINLFLFFMLILVLADSLVFLFVGWEGVGLCSYLLIGFWFTDKEKAVAGKKAFIVNRIGDFGFLLGMFMIVATLVGIQGDASPTSTNFLDIATLSQNAHLLGPGITLITLCLFFGATGKSAQIPLYIWLPDAMAGPTPVSALIHAATMVTAGIYMIAKLSFLFVLAPITLHVIAIVGVSTAFIAALIGLTQYDIKKVLAYSTVSQLGYMFLALGVGAFSGAIFHVFTHAFFKAGLFLCAGSVINSLHHEQDIRQMGGLWKKMPITAITFLLFTLAISGIPPFSGFFSKDEILYMTYANGQHPIYYWLGLLTAGITAFYMMRAFVYTFMGETRYKHPEKIHESPAVMTYPLIILAVFASLVGFIGLPHIFGHNWFGHWLNSLGQHTPHHIDGSFLQEGHLMLISTAWAVFCLYMAYRLYTKNLNFTAPIKKSLSFLYNLVYNKFKVDELYNALIITPIKVISDCFLNKIFDAKIIDGLMVNGLAHASRFFARSLSIIQTGYINHYVFYLLIGLWLVLITLVLT